MCHRPVSARGEPSVDVSCHCAPRLAQGERASGGHPSPAPVEVTCLARPLSASSSLRLSLSSSPRCKGWEGYSARSFYARRSPCQCG